MWVVYRYNDVDAMWDEWCRCTNEVDAAIVRMHLILDGDIAKMECV